MQKDFSGLSLSMQTKGRNADMKILIVDDYEQILKLVTKFLEAKGYTTITAENGVEGVRIAKAEQPALILMDIQMPKMNGINAMKLLKSAPSTMHIPICALSALAIPNAKEIFTKMGFDGYIAKPIDMQELLRTVEKAALGKG